MSFYPKDSVLSRPVPLITPVLRSANKLFLWSAFFYGGVRLSLLFYEAKSFSAFFASGFSFLLLFFQFYYFRLVHLQFTPLSPYPLSPSGCLLRLMLSIYPQECAPLDLWMFLCCRFFGLLFFSLARTFSTYFFFWCEDLQKHFHVIGPLPSKLYWVYTPAPLLLLVTSDDPPVMF